MEKSWNFIVNPFEKATRDSYIHAVKISTVHDSALAAMQTDPFFGPLYTSYHPVHTTFISCYTNWLAKGGARSGQTLNLEQLLQLLSSTKIDNWDINVQAVFNKKTPQYKALLPHHRVPFQRGKQDERIAAVKSFSLNLTGIAALASVKTSVDAFYTQLEAANASQKSSKTNTGIQSDAVETSRISMCVAQYSNLGLMMSHFSAVPEKISAFFDLKTIRKGAQVSFTGHLKPGCIYSIFKHTFAAEDTMTLSNDSDTALLLYLADKKDAVAGAIFIKVAPRTKQGITASELGDLKNTYLILSNPDANIVAGWELNLE